MAATDGDDDGAIHGDDMNRAFPVVFVGVGARWSSRSRLVVELADRRRHRGAGSPTCEGAATPIFSAGRGSSRQRVTAATRSQIGTCGASRAR